MRNDPKAATASHPQRIVFLVPRYTFESVSFIAHQYVQALSACGLDARIASLRRSTLPADPLLNRSRWSLVSCNVLVTHLFLPDLVGCALSRLIPSIRWVPFLHCDIVGGLAAERRPLAKLKAWLWRAALSRAEMLISPSRYALHGARFTGTSIVVPHCIVPSVEAAFRRRAGSGGNEVGDAMPAAPPVETQSSYVFIGRDTRGKRLSTLLRMLGREPTARLKVIGAIEHSRSVLERMEPSALARCALLGRCYDPYRHVAVGEVVVCPSGREGFGLVPLECLARRIPVAVINEGVFRELYGGTSIVYDRIDELPKIIGEAGQFEIIVFGILLAPR